MIVGLGFVSLETDFYIYIRRDVIIEVYIDDIKIVASTMEQCQMIYEELKSHLKIESKGSIKSFLGINFTRNWSQHHLAIFTRPDIAFAASKLPQFNSNPTAKHLTAALHVLRYLKGTRNLAIIYKRQEHNLTIIGHSDSDWAADANDRKSCTGYCFMVHSGPATWNSHKQATVAHSSIDAEYMAISDASREAMA